MNSIRWVLVGLLVLMTSIASASAVTFYWSGSGAQPFSFGGGSSGSIGISEPWIGHYGVTYSPSSTTVRGGWSALGGSGAYGYYRDYSYNSYSGLTNYGVNSPTFRSSYGYYPRSYYGGYSNYYVNSPRYSPSYSYYGSSYNLQYRGFTSDIPYDSYGYGRPFYW